MNSHEEENLSRNEYFEIMAEQVSLISGFVKRQWIIFTIRTILGITLVAGIIYAWPSLWWVLCLYVPFPLFSALMTRRSQRIYTFLERYLRNLIRTKKEMDMEELREIISHPDCHRIMTPDFAQLIKTDEAIFDYHYDKDSLMPKGNELN